MKRSRHQVLLVALLLLAAARGCGGDSDVSDAPSAGVSGAAGLAGSSGSAASAGKSMAGAGGSAGADGGGAGAGGVVTPLGGGGKTAGSAGGGMWASGGATVGNCGLVPPPDVIPPDWVEWNGWSCDCRFYRPPSPDKMPEPITWMPCPDPTPKHLDCRTMKMPWGDPPGLQIGVDPWVSFDEATGKPLVHMQRVGYRDKPGLRTFVVAEADGDTRFALSYVKPDLTIGCDAVIERSWDGRLNIAVYGDSSTKKSQEGPYGLLTGKVTEPEPTRVIKKQRDSENVSAWYVSSKHIVERYTGLYRWPLDGGDPVQFFTVSNRGVAPIHVQPVGDDIFINVAGGKEHATYHYSEKTGARPFLESESPYQSEGNFATDGKDMVWGSGWLQDGFKDQWKTDVMTAPFTNDPATAVATTRKLTKDSRQEGWDAWPYKVGCGYAAKATGVKGHGNALFIVRLSDGASWLIDGTTENLALGFGKALAVTCDDVYALANFNSKTNVARIRLDSLGPPQPAQ